MKTNPVPPRLPTPPGTLSNPATKPNGTRHFKIEDIQKCLNLLPKAKQNYALELFPKDSTGRLVKIDENSFKEFGKILNRKERHIFRWIPPNLKDARQFTEEPAQQARRPAKGEDLTSPIGFHGKPNSESAKPQPRPLADWLAEEKAGQDTHVPPNTRTQGQPNHVGFSDVARARLFPKGEDFNPGDFHPDWPRQVIDGPKGRVKKSSASITNSRPVIKISVPDSAVSKLGGLGQKAPDPLHNGSYLPPPPSKGILKKTAPGQETSTAQETSAAQETTPAKKTEEKEAGTKKKLLGGAAALGAGLAITGLTTAAGLILASKKEDSSSSAPDET